MYTSIMGDFKTEFSTRGGIQKGLFTVHCLLEINLFLCSFSSIFHLLCLKILFSTFQAPEILKSLEAMQTREVQSILIDHESLNVIIRFVEVTLAFSFLVLPSCNVLHT